MRDAPYFVSILELFNSLTYEHQYQQNESNEKGQEVINR